LRHDLRDLRLVPQFAAELEVAALEVARHRQRAAQRVAGVAGVQPGQRDDQRHGAHRLRHEGDEGVAQQRRLEARRQVGHAELAPAPCGQQPREHAGRRLERVAQPHELARRHVCRHVGAREAAHVAEHPLDQLGVCGGELAEVRLQPVHVAPKDHLLPAAVLVLEPDVEVDGPQVAEQPDLTPELVHARGRGRADEPVDAVVDRVPLAVPRGHEAARQVVHLVDARAVAVHLRVDARA